jgi:glyoxylase-like metal-dependent hydrolase (beta-lactamase superfamily II)
MFSTSVLGSIRVLQGQAGPIYLVNSADGVTVIDAGFPSDARTIIKFLKNVLSRSADSIKLIIFTHSHFDHINGADCLVDKTGARIAAHMTARKYLTGAKALPVTSFSSYIGFLVFLVKNGFPRPSIPDVFTMPRAGIPGLKKGIKTEVAAWLDEGKPIPGLPGWEVIHTPGHTDDGICLYHFKEKILFSGDTIINDKGIVKLNPLLTWNKAELKNSFKKLRQLRVDCLFPGWGLPVIGHDIMEDVR